MSEPETTKEVPDHVVAGQDLAAAIEAAGLTVECTPIDSRPDRMSMDKHSGHYRFIARATKDGKVVAEHLGYYSVGSAILTNWAGKNNGRGWNSSLFRAPGWSGFSNLSVAQSEQLQEIRKAYRPSTTDVISSMLLDTVSHTPDGTFRDWLEASGFDWKDPADALECFEAIRSEARFLRRALEPEVLDKMHELATRL